jgi:hypothetical protein
LDDPEAMRRFGPLAVTPSGHRRKNGIFFLLSLRGFSTLFRVNKATRVHLEFKSPQTEKKTTLNLEKKRKRVQSR